MDHTQDASPCLCVAPIGAWLHAKSAAQCESPLTRSVRVAVPGSPVPLKKRLRQKAKPQQKAKQQQKQQKAKAVGGDGGRPAFAAAAVAA